MDGIDLVVDPQRTCLQARFFSTFTFDSREELFAAIAGMSVGVDAISQSRDSRLLVYSGWVYWFLFLKGYLEAEQSGGLQDENTYLDYILRFYGPRGHDPGLAVVMANSELVRQRVEKRFALAASAAEAVERNGGHWQVDPVVVYLDVTHPNPSLGVFLVGSDDPVVGKLVDGWHRLFIARLFGLKSLPGRVVAHEEEAA